MSDKFTPRLKNVNDASKLAESQPGSRVTEMSDKGCCEQMAT